MPGNRDGNLPRRRQSEMGLPLTDEVLRVAVDAGGQAPGAWVVAPEDGHIGGALEVEQA